MGEVDLYVNKNCPIIEGPNVERWKPSIDWAREEDPQFLQCSRDGHDIGN